jgi:hypothetical protein
MLASPPSSALRNQRWSPDLSRESRHASCRAGAQSDGAERSRGRGKSDAGAIGPLGGKSVIAPPRTAFLADVDG